MSVKLLYVSCFLNMIFLSAAFGEANPQIDKSNVFDLVIENDYYNPSYSLKQVVLWGLADNGDVTIRADYGVSVYSSGQETVVQKKTISGSIFDLSPRFSPGNCTGVNCPIVDYLLQPAVSQNGMYTYYLMQGAYPNQSWEYVKYNNSVEKTSTLLDLTSLGFTSASSKVNNNGMAVVNAYRTNGSFDVLRVDKNGETTTLLSNLNMPGAPITYGFTAISNLDTIFVILRVGSQNRILSIDSSNQPREIASFYSSGLTYMMYASSQTTSLYPEGILYYVLDQKRIISTDGREVLNLNAVPNYITNFDMNDSGEIVWGSRIGSSSFTDEVYKNTYKPEDRLIGTGDIINGKVVSGAYLPKINSLGQVAVSVQYQDLISNGIYRTAVRRLCKVQDRGVIVNFQPQGGANTPWAKDLYGFNTNAARSMAKFGCGTSSLSMLFNAYGINRTRSNELMNPGTLNKAMNGKSVIDTLPYKLGYNSSSSILWKETEEVARRAYINSCANALIPKPVAQCKQESIEKVVWKGIKDLPERVIHVDRNGTLLYYETKASYDSRIASEQSALIAEVEQEICNGNPVILKLDAPGGSSGMHFVLATGVGEVRGGGKTLIVQNPGSSAEGEDITLDELKNEYPNILGYRLYRTTPSTPAPAAARWLAKTATVASESQAAVIVSGSYNVHFVVTDPMGRRTGYDPVNRISYNENPDSIYTNESYNTPNEEGVTFERQALENIFEQNSNVTDGNYNVQVFGMSNSSYTLSISSFGDDGFKNNESDLSGNIRAGEVKSFDVPVKSEPLPDFNAALDINSLIYSDIDTRKLDPMVLISGQMKLKKGETFNETSSAIVSIGSPSDFTVEIAARKFKSVKGKTCKEFHYEINKEEKIILFADGRFSLQIRDKRLKSIPISKKQNIFVKIGDKSAFQKLSLKCISGICFKK